MTGRELDELFRGQSLVRIGLTSGDALWFNQHDLATPVAWRSAMRRQMPAGWEAPVYDQADHDQIIRVIFQLCDADEQGRAA